MKYLLDTHTLLWYLDYDENLSKTAKNIINTQNCCYSIATLWEIAIKNSIGKLKLDVPINELSITCEKQNIQILPILPHHINGLIDMPFIHRDPFDRLLISQAKTENLTIITRDAMIKKYDVSTLW